MVANLYWLCLEAPPALEAQAGDFLSQREQAIYAALRFPKRRADWLLGRWAAKQLVHALPIGQALPWSAIEVLPSLHGPPQLHLAGRPADEISFSLSHADGRALCVLCERPNLRLGADLERIEGRPDAFLTDYFTPFEQQQVLSAPPEQRALLITLLWSLKEAVLKALGVGLRLDTRRVEVALQGEKEEEWQAADVRISLPPTGRWWAAWRQAGDFVLALAVHAEEQEEIRPCAVRVDDEREPRSNLGVLSE